jgi:MFS family permease
MSLISAWVGVRLGLKAVLLIGSFTYVVWTLIITVDSHPLIMFCAIINGLGASLLWVHEGIWISRLIKSDFRFSLGLPNLAENPVSRDGTLTGLFFGIYNFSGILGNIVIMILVKYIDLILILRIMSGFTLLTWVLFWFLPYPLWNKWIICWNHLNDDMDDMDDLHNEIDESLRSANSSPLLTPEDSRSNLSLDEFSSVFSISSEISMDNTFGSTISDSSTASTEASFENTDERADANSELPESPTKGLTKDNSLKNHSRRLARVWSSDKSLMHSSADRKEVSEVETDEESQIRSNDENRRRGCEVGKYPFLIPLMVEIALLNLLSYGIISALSGKSLVPGYDGAFVIAGYFLLYSISSAIFSIAWGYLYDWLGWIFLLSVVEILLLAELLFIAINLNFELDVSLNPVLSVYYVWWIIAIVAGVIDTGCNVLLNASISFTFDKEVAPYVFSWYRFIYCMSMAIFSVINYIVAPLYIMYSIMGWSVIMGLSIIWFKVRA